jgi:hypothetical protein
MLKLVPFGSVPNSYDEKGDRLTMTGDDYGLRSAFALRAAAGQGRIFQIVHRNRRP